MSWSMSLGIKSLNAWNPPTFFLNSLLEKPGEIESPDSRWLLPDALGVFV